MNDENKKQELKPCPFCGGKAITKYYALHNNAVECCKCQCSTPHGFVNMEQAIVHWNRRYSERMAKIEVLEEVVSIFYKTNSEISAFNNAEIMLETLKAN